MVSRRWSSLVTWLVITDKHVHCYCEFSSLLLLIFLAQQLKVYVCIYKNVSVSAGLSVPGLCSWKTKVPNRLPVEFVATAHEFLETLLTDKPRQQHLFAGSKKYQQQTIKFPATIDVGARDIAAEKLSQIREMGTLISRQDNRWKFAAWHLKRVAEIRTAAVRWQGWGKWGRCWVFNVSAGKTTRGGRERWVVKCAACLSAVSARLIHRPYTWHFVAVDRTCSLHSYTQ